MEKLTDQQNPNRVVYLHEGLSHLFEPLEQVGGWRVAKARP
jgi:hypothetical protein